MRIPQNLIFTALVLFASLAFSALLPKRAATPPVFAQQKGHKPKVAPGQIIVKLKSGSAAQALQSAQLAFRASPSLSKKFQTLAISKATKLFPEETTARGHPYPDLLSIYQLSFPESQDPVQVAAVFANDPNVEYAEPRYARELHFTPNDSLYTLQNHLNQISAPLAWDLQQGDSTVVIGIVDSGVDWVHPDLAANIWRNSGEIPDNGIDDDLNGYVDDVRGWDFGDQDNDPKNRNPASTASHGTLVAGVAGAVTDNSSGIAGVGFNCKIMPVKAISDQQQDQQFLMFGFEGIKYAAENGADIINVSWGGPVRSRFEDDVVRFAEAMGSLIVASAGNENNSTPNYPAAFPQALSVASIDSEQRKTNFSSFGSWVNVTAPGISILSTERSAGFGFATGTSFSSPMVSGVAGLVKSRNPLWSPEQVREQVRLSADNVDAFNLQFENQLGNGLLNAFSAMTKSSPAVRIDKVTVDDSQENGNDVPEAGETIDLVVSIKNLLAPASDLNLELTVGTSAISIIDGTAKIPFIGSGETVRNLEDALTIRISSAAGRGARYRLTFLISTDDGQYQDRDFFDLVVAPTYLDHDVGNVTLTLTSRGNLGFNDFPANREGKGFVFNRDGNNLLFEGAVLAGVGPRQVSDGARRSPAGSRSTDFQTRPGNAIVFQRPGPEADEQSLATFSDRNRPFGTVGVDITQEGLSFAAHPNDDFVLLKYVINNRSVVNRLDSLYFGLLLDWNIDQEHYKDNLAGFDSELQLGYMFSPDLPTYCGVKVLNAAGVASYRAIDNATDLFDESFEFTEEKKYEFLSGGLARTMANTPGDYSQLISTGPFTMVPKATVIAGFALIGGTGLEDLKRNALAAQKKWDEIVGINLPGNLPSSFVLKQNYPNPFNPETNLEYELPKAAFLNITIYNILGKEIITLIHEPFDAGRYVITWNGIDRNGRAVASGVYVARMLTAESSRSIKMLLVR